MNSATLWKHVSWLNGQDRKLLRLCLDRFPFMSTLNIRLHDQQPTSEVIRHLSLYGPHSQTLDIHQWQYSDSNFFLVTLKFNAPHLRSLVLRQNDCFPNGDHIDPSREVEILNGFSFRLEAFCSVGGTSFIPANHFPSLTHLLLDVKLYYQLSQLNGVVELLRRTPLLRCLALCNFSIEDTFSLSPSAHGSTKVQLHFLRRLTISISVSISGAAAFLSRLCLRSECVSTYIYSAWSSGPLEPDVFNSFIQTCVPSHFHGRNVYVNVLSYSYDKMVVVVDAPTFCFFLKTRADVNWARSDAHIRRLLQIAPPQCIQSLHLTVYNLSGTDLHSSLLMLTHLTHLQLVFLGDSVYTFEECMTALCLALGGSHALQLPVSTNSAGFACLRLSSLSISAFFRNMEKCATYLKAMLCARAKAGYCISNMAIQCLILWRDPYLGRGEAAVLEAEKQSQATAHKLQNMLEDCVENYLHVPSGNLHFCRLNVRDTWTDLSMESKYWLFEKSYNLDVVLKKFCVA